MIRLKSTRGSGETPDGKRFEYSILELTGIGQSTREYQLELQVDGQTGMFSDIVEKGKPIDFAGEKWIF
ncbi:hypothetical protein [Leuconostoc pseudomesenteroides]|uniref:hypothetical protein n=1 Tax=Leuconostoc pseudomesenteroides TaxID=33968 RepID=UPI002286C521|nr:hypothetical protein [Leuconostoc pseudomesenteroides]WAM37843.1 hypothetical protein OYT93_06445 [Leuconostoc pseudomesenteroides]